MEKKAKAKKTGEGLMFFQKTKNYREKQKVKFRNRLKYLLRKEKLGTITESEKYEMEELKFANN